MVASTFSPPIRSTKVTCGRMLTMTFMVCGLWWGGGEFGLIINQIPNPRKANVRRATTVIDLFIICWSGCRELNPGYKTPSLAYYHYTTPRNVQTLANFTNCTSLYGALFFMQRLYAFGAGQSFFALVGGFLKIWFIGSFGGYVSVTAKKLASVADAFLFTTNYTGFRHGAQLKLKIQKSKPQNKIN